MQLSDYSHGIASHFVFQLIGSFIPAPPGNDASPPGVTHKSSLPCRPQTPWCGGWIGTPSPPSCRLDLAPPLADRFIIGVAPSITARCFSSNPSDSTSRWTPCPPESSSDSGQQGIIPTFGYSAPYPSTGGTLTLMTNALPSAHYEPLRLPRQPGILSALAL